MTIAQEWWDRKSMGCLWPPCCKGSYSMTTTSVSKNHGSEDTFRAFRCFYCKVKSSFDLLFVTQKSVLQKKNGMTLQWVPAHIFSPAGCQRVCDQGAALPLTLLMLLPQCGEGKQAMKRAAIAFTDFPATASKI